MANDTQHSAPGIYLSAMGAAAAVTVFDGMMNEKSAALMKAAGWFSRIFAGSDQAAKWYVSSLIFFCLFAGLVAFAYKPREPKEAFMLGAGVLALLNALVKPPNIPDQKVEVTYPLTKSVAWLSIISTSFAGGLANSQGNKTELWLAIDGVQQFNNPQTSIYIYDATSGLPIVNSKVYTGTKFELPSGNYNIEITHPGYRSVVFSANLDGSSVAYKPRLNQSKFDNFSNLFGPQKITLKQNEKLSTVLPWVASKCSDGDVSASEKALKAVSGSDIDKFKNDPLLKSTLCLKD